MYLNINNIKITIWTLLDNKLREINGHPIKQLITISVLLFAILEILSRRSVTGGFALIISNPLMFILNVLIILLTLSVAMMFSKKNFVLVLISTLWLGIGGANFVLLSFRSTPLTAMDFYMIKSAIGIIHIYLNTFQIILISTIIPVVIIAMVLLWKKFKNEKPLRKLSLIAATIILAFILLVSNVSLKVNALSSNFANLSEAFSKYGFVYCFSNSIFDRGIKKPSDYCDENIATVLRIIGDDSDITVDNRSLEVKPNIVFILLESFFDVNYLLDYSFTENPIPNFTWLKNNFSNGFLTVPSIGAGTANTEFEILTGMNVEHFGAGEYPYKTILQRTTCESMAYNLGELGYYSHAIHNNTATFYSRHVVFENLGFDSFSSIEYMNYIEYNPIGWAKDYVLKEEILKALQAKDSANFIYTISVQPHGRYPDKVVDENQRIKLIDPTINTSNMVDSLMEVNPLVMDEGHRNRLEYFVNQLAETDEFIGELINKLSAYEEPTVVVFFGDHLPSLSIENEDLANGNKFQTEYVIWSNFPMEMMKRDLNAYQLSAYVMERLGYSNGIFTRFHQRFSGEEDYQENLKLLQYDMLYGRRSIFEGDNPFRKKEMKMGILDISITNVYEKGDVIFVNGKNFTPWSVVYIDDKPKETLYIDESTLIVPYERYNGETVFVAQVSDANVLLSHSKPWNPR